MKSLSHQFCIHEYIDVMRGLRNARLRHESVTGTSGEERTTASEVAVNVMNGMRGDITYPDCKPTAASAVTATDTVRWMFVLYVHVSVLTR